jgi:tetratricopeptide (TPR) repeat protein
MVLFSVRPLLDSIMATASKRLGLAIQHHQAGRLQAAEQIYRQILSAEPNQADALHLLGVIAHQVGKHGVAVEYIKRAIALKGNVANYHNNLGEAYRSLRRLPEAVVCYRRAQQLMPNSAEVHNNLGNALRDLNELEQSVLCYRRALQLMPDYAEAHNNLGNALHDQGKLAEAVVCYRRALQLMPNYGEAHNNLGAVLREQGLLEEAVACHRRACALKPDSAEVHSNLGNALRDQGKVGEAITCYRQALQRKPDYAEAHSNLGSALEEIGDLQAAEVCFHAALRHNPRNAMAHFLLAELLREKLSEKDLAAQLRLLEEKGTTDAERLLLHFGLAQVLDARGEYGAAAEHLKRGNALQLSEWRKRGHEYDPLGHESFIGQMIAACTPDFFARVRGSGLESKLPVFVFGLPRSGTTLIEQILASHSRVHGAGELYLGRRTLEAIPGALGRAEPPVDCIPYLGATELHRLGAQHVEQLQVLAGGQVERVVDKMPDNYMYLGLLAALFPQAVFIHCRRDLRDVAVSCWMTHFREVHWANDPQHIALRFHAYQRAMAHWRKVLPGRVLEVDYEETVADLEGVARRLVAWCGLEWEPACLEFHQAKRPVRTASILQVRQPIFKTSVGRWKHYESALAPLFAHLETVGIPLRD